MGPRLKQILLFSLFCLAFIVTSCSSSVTQLQNTTLTLIYDYPSEGSKADVQLAVFTDPGNNPRKCSQIRLDSKDTVFEWITDNPVKYQYNKRNVAGYTNFVMPSNIPFPKGKYTLYYLQTDGTEYEQDIKLDYDESFYKADSNDVYKLIANGNFSQKIAVYDENKVLLYFGDYTPELKNNSNIQKRYTGADSKRFIWISKDFSVCCLLPIEKLNTENKKDE